MKFTLVTVVTLLVDLLVARTIEANLSPNERWATQDDTALLQGILKPFSKSAKKHVVKKVQEQSSALGKCVEKYADGLDALHHGLGNAIRAHPQTVVAKSSREMIFAAQPGKTGSRSLQVALIEIANQFNETWKVSHQKTTTKDNEAWLCSLFDTLSQPTPQCLPSLRSFDFTGISEDVGAMVSQPVFEVFIDLYLAFPEARWIVTPRPSEEWAASYTFEGPTAFWPLQEPCGQNISAINEYPQFKAQMYELTSAFVDCVVPPEKMLVLDIFTESTEGMMKRLREFLGYPANDIVDTAEFPHIDEDSSVRAWWEEGLIPACGSLANRVVSRET